MTNISNDFSLDNFNINGIAIIDLLSLNEHLSASLLITNHINRILGFPEGFNLSLYHHYYQLALHDRSVALQSANRHLSDTFWSIHELSSRLLKYIRNHFGTQWFPWDEGLGPSAFRIIRPGYDDGYPPSRKSWGPAGQVISTYIPIIGFTHYESPGYVIPSHNLDPASYIPTDSKFCNDERRLLSPKDFHFTRFSFSPGQALIYHWNTLHTEQIIGLDTTRISLEFRYVSH